MALVGRPFVLAVALLAVGAAMSTGSQGQAAPLSADASTSPSPSPDPFDVAEALAANGLRAAAVEQAKLAIQSDPRRALGSKTQQILDEPFAEAFALAAAGFDAKAVEAANAAVAAHPGSTFPPRLAYLNGDALNNPLRSRSTRLDNTLINWGGWALVFLVVLLIALPLSVRLYLALPLFPWAHRQLRRAVMTPRNDVWRWVVHWILRWVLFLWVVEPRMRISVGEHAGEKDEVAETVPRIGQSLAVVVEAELDLLREEGGSTGLRLTRTPDTKLDIPEALKELPWQGKLFGSLAYLLPSNDHSLALTLHPRSDRGVGLTASMVGPKGQLLGSNTFWEKTYDTNYAVPSGDKDAVAASAIAAYERLAIAAASWAVYQPPISDNGHAAGDALTKIWQSYVYHRIAARWQDDGQNDRAKALYLTALRHDPTNIGSLLNLAVLEWGDNDRARAEERLREAARLTERTASDGGRDRGWYRIRYNLAAVLLERLLDTRSTLGDVANDIAIYEEARKVERAIEERGPFEAIEIEVAPSPSLGREIAALDDAERMTVDVLAASDTDEKRHGVSAERRAFLGAIRSAAAVVLASAWIGMGRGRRSLLPASLPTRYRAAGGAREPDHVIAALDAEAGSRTAHDPTVRYDLACYYAQRGSAREALDELRYGLLPGQAEKALSDPALRPLSGLAEFARILARDGSKEPDAKTTSLARIGLIGAKVAARLHELGVTDADELMRRVATPQDRRTLSADIRVAPELLEQWAQLLRLRGLPGLAIPLGCADLLFRAGIRSPGQLATKDPAALCAVLRSLNEVRQSVDVVPTDAQVRSWIEAARLAEDQRIPIG